MRKTIMSRMSLAHVFVLGLALGLAGCGTKGDQSSGGTGSADLSQGGGSGTVSFAEIEVTPALVVITSPGTADVRTLVIDNTGESDLNVAGFQVNPVAGDAFRITEVRGCTDAGCGDTWDASVQDLSAISPALVVGASDATGYNALEVTIEYTPDDNLAAPESTLIITSDAKSGGSKAVSLTTATGQAEILVTPLELDFGSVGSGEEEERFLTIYNVGSDNLEISKMDFTGPSSFSLDFDEQLYQIGTIDFGDSPVVILPNGQMDAIVRYAPVSAEPETATLTLLSNDAQSPTTQVIIKANTSGPKMQIQPKLVNFGPNVVGQLSVLPVEISSIGTSDLEIVSLSWAEDSSADFSLDMTAKPFWYEGDWPFADGSLPSGDSPLVVPVNEKIDFQIRYVPDVENPKDENNVAIPDLGTLLVGNNTFEAIEEVEVSGIGVSVNCPVAVIVVQEGEQVIPQTVLHLFGDQSASPAGEIKKWEWSVEQPSGSQSLFLPSANFPAPTFEANVAGSYLFQLTVLDENDTPSCVPGEAQVVVIPDEAIHVELLWNTPNDPDQTDEGPEAGADVDLHFTHEFAGGPDLDGDGEPDGWFDQPFDCFWFNANPQWESFDPAIDDDPSLDRDDTDGAGPENLNLNIPQNDRIYRVGVHYWHDHGFGPSYATVRVYIYAQLVFELQDVKLVNHDMWEVCTIEWPSGQVDQVGDGFKITPNYENPFFYQP